MQKNENGLKSLFKSKPGKKVDCEERTILDDVMALEGMEEFKAYMQELEAIRHRLCSWNQSDAFPTQHLLFSINQGDGCSTALDLLFRYLSLGEIYKIGDSKKDKEEYRNGELIYRFNEDTNYPEERYLSDLESEIRQRSPGLIGIHIEGWINMIDSRGLMKLLKLCFELRHKITFVFIVPQLDDGALCRINKRLNDLLNVRQIRFKPNSDESLIKVAAQTLLGYGIKWDSSADRCFKHRLMLERSDGHFYGMQTAMKLATELILMKTQNIVHMSNNCPADLLMMEDFNVIDGEDAFNNTTSGYDQLDSMIGLDEVKKRVREIVVSIKYQMQISEKNGINVTKPCYHMMFTGNPGTGKTAVARIIGRIFMENGLLPVGDLLEVSRFDLVGECLGHTGPKTKALCRSATGSVLFIDEAYLLAAGTEPGGGKDFGAEALGALIAEMENNRDKFIVILAGYKDEMEKLCEINPGLRERIPHRIHFNNYTKDELYKIFRAQIQTRYYADESFFSRAEDYFFKLSGEVISSKEFGNARFVRNLVERVQMKALLRIDEEDITKSDRLELLTIDFDSAVADKDITDFNEKKKQSRIGFFMEG